MYKNILFFFLLFLKFILRAQSPLATGQVIKMQITENGVYQITGQTLKKNGFDLVKIKPETLRIVGNNGQMLPQSNGLTTANELPDCAYKLIGFEDGKFDLNDKIIFYGQGPLTIGYDAQKQEFNHELNLYSKYNSYFVVLGNGAGKVVNNGINFDASASVVTATDHYLVYEKDEINLLRHSGREWIGENITSGKTLEINFKINDALINSNAKLWAKIYGRTQLASTKFTIFAENNQITEGSIPAVSDYIYAQKANEKLISTNFEVKSSNPIFKINLLNNNNEGPLANLDWLAIQLKQNLVFDGSSKYHFQNIVNNANAIVSYKIQNLASAQVWDINQPNNPINQIIKDGAFSNISNADLKRFVAFDANKLPEPINFEKIEIQNLQNLNTPDLLIVTTKPFLASAQKLADFRQSNDNLSSLVVDVEQIYNEYSGGKVDVTAIRNFAKYLYNKQHGKLKYLLLFADANYDFRNLDEYVKDAEHKNFVPAYQSRNSIDPLLSFSSEDYFGFLENNEGDWPESNNNTDNHSLDIGVGRIPVNNEAQAEAIVDKLINYNQTSNTLGNWRTRLALSSDDGDANLHQEDSEDLAEIINNKGVDYSINKIYVDAYQRVGDGANGRKSPETNKKIKDMFFDGCLIFNYVGHGGAENLSDEKILLRDGELSAWQNRNRLPVMVTATCEFGRYDDPGEKSGAEIAVLNPYGGAIGLLTTTRAVYSISNKVINEAFYNALFQLNKNGIPRLGDILKITKNNSWQGVYNRNFTLLGDPSMQLALPKNKATITKINGKNISNTDTLRATQKVILEGEIRDFKNEIIEPTFNGSIHYQLFDKSSNLKTLGNNNNKPMNFKQYSDRLSTGLVEVKNGKFSIELTLPKSIRYNYGFGRLELYATNTTSSTDASGVWANCVIGGQNILANTTDTKGPEIILNFDEQSINNKQQVISNSPNIYIKLKDESGINTNNSNIGHDITITIDKKTSYILTDLYTATGQLEGVVNYILSDLSNGKHSIEIEAWDIFDNVGRYSQDIDVNTVDNGSIKGLIAYPNPLEKELNVSFENTINGQKDIVLTFNTLDGKKITDYQTNTIENSNKISIILPKNIVSKLHSKQQIIIMQVQVQATNEKKIWQGSTKIMVLN